MKNIINSNTCVKEYHDKKKKTRGLILALPLNPNFASGIVKRWVFKMMLVNPQSSRLVWETYLTEFKSLGRVAVRLIFLHATSRGFKCNWSSWRWVCSQGNSRAALDRAHKLIFIAAHSKFERKDFSTDEEKNAELFSLANGEDDVLNEVFVETSSA